MDSGQPSGGNAIADERFAIVYEQAERAIDRQASRLDEVRSRAATLFSAASIAASFLAGQALDNHGKFRGGTWVGVVSFVIVGLAASYVLVPRTRHWKFTLGAPTLLDQWIGEKGATIDQLRERLARLLDANYDHNERF